MAPVIYSGKEDTGISPSPGSDKFGPLGEIYAVTFHHSAGPRATSHNKACVLHRSYQKYHIEEGFGDIGYHFSIDDFGRIYRLRSLEDKGCHVGGHNTGNVGVMLHGNYMYDRLTVAQRETMKWLFRGGFLRLMNEREAGIALIRGHKEWPGHNSNLCPGTNLMRHTVWLRNTEFH
jgi:hypothetical protein